MVTLRLIKVLPCLFTVAEIAKVSGSSLRGISPEQLRLYTPLSQVANDIWQCLDKSKNIPYSAINDDYCDCPDGSDEPGTSACPNSIFYCENKGHIPTYIKSYAVNDGVCDEACCDGSDEFNGFKTCPNVCQKAAVEYKRYQAELHKIQFAGVTRKQQLVEEAAVAIDEWLIEKASLEQDINIKKSQLDNYKNELDILEKAHNKEYTTPAKVPRAKKQADTIILKEHIADLQEDIDHLISILTDLKSNHDENLNDEAVKSAISRFDEFMATYEDTKADTPHYTSTGEGEEEEVLTDVSESEPVSAEETASKEGNHPSLKTLLSKVVEILPVSLKDRLDKLLPLKEDNTVDHLRKSSEAALEAARATYNALASEVESQKSKINTLQENLGKDYGTDHEWLKLKNVCVEKNEGEYTYSICMLGRAHQKSNKDGASTNLGDFNSFTGNSQVNRGDYYREHLHSNGARCWNGPERSVRVFIDCGAETEILEVSEPEKCEYHFRMNSPAVCVLPTTVPIDEKEVKADNEAIAEKLHLHDEL
ncbi:glucosidase II beta subunit-like-domain-containing protein [Spinellus fusiger]|nr:glucosidase II beta subunit-like-domain-containing protein [Spinellus fusiger]